ncbi:MAG TPA: PEP-CTERM sorting domain-containing protein [Rhizomicrobium sp.]
MITVLKKFLDRTWTASGVRTFRLGVLAFGVMVGLAVPQAQAANIITFDDNATACGGSVLCSTNGTTGYNGTQAFDLSTISQWFQIGTAAQPTTAGQFLVVNNTGSTLTQFSLTITDNFNSGTPSVHACTGLQPGKMCDNFQANKGAAGGTSEELSGTNFDSCTNGTPSGHTCSSSAGQAAADFAPNKVTFTWKGLSIANGATFDITFASWNNSAYITPSQVPEPGSIALLGAGLLGFGAMMIRRRRKPAAA